MTIYDPRFGYGRESLLGSIKRKIFISYHHRNDQWYYDQFSQIFGTQYQLFTDRSLDGRIRSDDSDYVNRTIREDYIVGSSITIVLCGIETFKRKYVDWEIYSTLHHQHALMGIILPNVSKNYAGQAIVPDRLHDNIQTSYAHYVQWLPQAWTLNPTLFGSAIETAIQMSTNKSLIQNGRLKMSRNAA